MLCANAMVKFFSIYLFLHMCIGQRTFCGGLGVSSLLPLFGFWDQTPVIGLGGCHPYQLRHLAWPCLVPLFFEACLFINFILHIVYYDINCWTASGFYRLFPRQLTWQSNSVALSSVLLGKYSHLYQSSHWRHRMCSNTL